MTLTIIISSHSSFIVTVVTQDVMPVFSKVSFAYQKPNNLLKK